MEVCTICLLLAIAILLVVLYSNHSEHFAYTNEMRNAKRWYKTFHRNIRNADTKTKFDVNLAKLKESNEELAKLLPIKLKDSDPLFVAIIKKIDTLEKEIIKTVTDLSIKFDKTLSDVRADQIEQLKAKHQTLIDEADQNLLVNENDASNEVKETFRYLY